MSKVKIFLINSYFTAKQYLTQFFRIPTKINNITSDLEEIKIVLNNIDHNISEMKDIDFISVGKS